VKKTPRPAVKTSARPKRVDRVAEVETAEVAAEQIRMVEPAAASAPVAPDSAAILAIGDEVLSGEIINTNSGYLANHLSELGLHVVEHAVVADQPDGIQAALSALSKKAAVLVVTGGLGPTDDDRTVDVVCSMLGVDNEPHAASLEAMKKRFSAHGFELTPNNLRQVRIPRGAEALPNGAGIAPGFRMRLGGAESFFLPGIPREMERIFADHVAPGLRTLLAERGVPAAAVRTWHLYGMGESHIDHRLAGLLQGMPAATLHFRTDAPENHVKVVVRGSSAAENREKLEQIDRELRKRIGAGIYGVDGDTFPLVVGRTLRENQATLALAESCTGGMAGELITKEPGASDFFLGGVMAYANDVKVKVLGVRPETLADQGAVSEPCAKEMAEGARRITGATLAVAITGIAGSSRDGTNVPVQSEGGKPVGTVCFALAGPKSTKTVSKLLSGGRDRIRRAAAYFALDMARRQFL
jgi:nicotinamide-nucleotide amidase